MNGGRNHLQFDDPLLKDTVADNLALDDFVTEGDEILFGMNFGIVTDIQTGPDGALYLVGPAGPSWESPAVATSIVTRRWGNAFSEVFSAGGCCT